MPFTKEAFNESERTFKYKGDILPCRHSEVGKSKYLCHVSVTTSHIANIDKITATGIHWYSYTLGKKVSGLIKFSEMKEL